MAADVLRSERGADLRPESCLGFGRKPCVEEAHDRQLAAFSFPRALRPLDQLDHLMSGDNGLKNNNILMAPHEAAKVRDSKEKR
jgi:hypothetical protein